MAKKEEKSKVELEREYNIPLRKEWLKVARWKRTKKAVKAAKEFLQKHMKSDNVKLGKALNEHIWKHGGRNPPHHVKVKVTKDSEGLVFAELEGVNPAKKPEAPKGVEKKVSEKNSKEKNEKTESKKSEEKPAMKKETKSEKSESKKEENSKKEEKTEKPAKADKEKEEQEKVADLAKEIMQKGKVKKS